MFSKHNDQVLPDLSTDLSDGMDWKVGTLRTFHFPLNVTTLAVEPIAGLLAAGTADGVIHVFGGPSVETKIKLPEPVGIRFLLFSISTYFIVCFDDNNQLYLYNLLEFGRPKLVTSARFDQTNSITLSPSHNHVLISLQNGDVKTYDLICLRKSPYTMPNMWKLYEESMTVNGVPSLVEPAPRNTVDTVIHPRNLNLVFVAYAGGVILTDLTERNTLRAYELVLPPGAPGGAGYGAHDILTHRRMIVTCVAVHPSGHFFAVGYADGSLAFWAVEDDDKPLAVRTLATEDVHIADSNQLEAHLSSAAGSKAPQSVREPVFKMSWSGFPNSSDPRGGETVLTILGGLDAGKPPGVTAFALPAFNPAEPPVDPSGAQKNLHPAFRHAMCQSVTPKKSFFYETRGVVQDYLLIPRANPHLGGNFDPYAILFIIEVEDTRNIDTFQFPAPGLVSIKMETAPTPAQTQHADDQDEEVEAGLLKSPQPPTPVPKSPRHLNLSPQALRLPFTLSNGSSGVTGGSLFTLDTENYDNFILQAKRNAPVLELRGGRGFVDTTQVNELKLSKYQPRRILYTYNEDLTVQFFDLSTTLLIPAQNMPLSSDWPKPIPALTVHLDDLFDDAAFSQSLSTSLDKVSIHSTQIASEALELGVALNSGEVLIYHEARGPAQSKGVAEAGVTLLTHIRPSRNESRLTPYFMLAGGKGPVETFALSDTGFLAVSYLDGSLTVVDMRGPKIIHSHGANKKQHKHLSSIHVPGSPTGTGPDIITCLKWTVSPLEKDPQLRVRLIAVLQSGHIEIYTLVCTGNPATWSVAGDPIPSKGVPDALPDGAFVLDTKSGAQWRANSSKLVASFRNEKVPTNAGPQVVLLTVGTKSARVCANVNGEKMAKVEWGSKAGNAVIAQVVLHNGSHALVVQTDRNDALAYTLPYLEHVTTVQLPHPFSVPLSIDDSGDYISWTQSAHKGRGRPHFNGAIYGTFFDVRRAFSPPDIDFASTRGSIPSQPQPVSLGPTSYLGSWFSFNQTKTGDQIDELLGGPNRPIPEKIALEKARAANQEAGIPAEGGAAGLAASAAAVQANIYNKLTSAIGERGQLLGDLEERFNSLEEGSRSMVAQAKRLAAQQTAKSWFGF